MRIAIEGMDGTGKTTVAKAIAELLDYSYVTKPFNFLFQEFGFNEKQIKNIEWKLYETYDEALISLFYGMGLLYGTRILKEENIIYDRHFVSNYYWHGNEETDSLHDKFIELCGKPDLTILLKASTNTRIQRIATRDSKDSDLDNSAMYEDGFNKMVKFLVEKGFDYMIVDTENKTVEEVINECIGHINQRKIKYVRSRKK